MKKKKATERKCVRDHKGFTKGMTGEPWLCW
jgi:hypothetical protein